MARREDLGKDCRAPDASPAAIPPRSATPSKPTASRRIRASTGGKSPCHAASTALPFIPDQPHTSFSDIFTAVLGSKLARQSTPKSPQHPEPPLRPTPTKRTCLTENQAQNAPPPLASSVFVCRVRGDRERQLDTRCLRIIRKLNFYPEYQEIVRRLASAEGAADTEELATGCVNRTKLCSSSGVRAYLTKYLRLKEPRPSPTASQATLLLSGDSTPERSLLRDANESPNRYDPRGMSRNGMAFEQWSEIEENGAVERSVTTTNGLVEAGTKTSASGAGNLPPETLLRRLARSISTRLAYKRRLLEQTAQRLGDLDKRTDVVRSVLLKVTDEALPQMHNGMDVCYFHIPSTAQSTVTVEVELRRAASSPPSPPASATSLVGPGPSARHMLLSEVTPNLLPRFNRLFSSQVAVLELLCQLTRRLYCLDRRIIECVSAGTDTTVHAWEGQSSREADATLFSLRSRRQQLTDQLEEAQRLRNDFEAIRSRLLSGLQHHFFVLRNSRLDENPFAFSEGHERCDSSGQSSPSTPQRSEMDSVVCLGEFISRHLDKYLQTLLIKLTLETEIFDDQEAVDCVGEHLRLVASFSP